MRLNKAIAVITTGTSANDTSNSAAGTVNIKKMYMMAAQCHPSTIMRNVKMKPKRCSVPFIRVTRGRANDTPLSMHAKSTDKNRMFSVM